MSEHTFRPQDLRIDVFRGGMAQPVEVRVVHTPSGMITRGIHISELEAKRLAFKFLEDRLSADTPALLRRGG